MQGDDIIEDDSSGPANPEMQPVSQEQDNKASKRLATLVSVFPTVDPDFLRQKGLEIGFETGSEDKLNRWIESNLGNGCKDLPTREDYEKRTKEAEIIKKFQVR